MLISFLFFGNKLDKFLCQRNSIKYSLLLCIHFLTVSLLFYLSHCDFRYSYQDITLYNISQLLRTENFRTTKARSILQKGKYEVPTIENKRYYSR